MLNLDFRFVMGKGIFSTIRLWCVLLFAALVCTTALAWDPVSINGVRYVPMSDMRGHYKFTSEERKDSRILYKKPGIVLEVKPGSQNIKMNGLKFVLSFPIVNHQSKGLMVAVLDLHKIFEPVLRPVYIKNRRTFDTVVIDAGHGGHDAGAVNRMAREADLNLDVAKKLQTILKQQGLKTVMTRTTNTFLTLQQRVDIANKYQNAIFVSIHFNSGSPSAHGIEVFTLAPAGTSSALSPYIRKDSMAGNAHDSLNIALATGIQGHLLKGSATKKYGFTPADRGIQRARFSVLCTIKHPAVLVEGGFMSHAKEGYLVTTENYKNFVAQSIANGIKQYKTAISGKRATY